MTIRERSNANNTVTPTKRARSFTLGTKDKKAMQFEKDYKAVRGPPKPARKAIQELIIQNNYTQA